jgi:hypothetical protein
LLEQIHGLHPHCFPAAPPPRIQAATIGVPHAIDADRSPALRQYPERDLTPTIQVRYHRAITFKSLSCSSETAKRSHRLSPQPKIRIVRDSTDCRRDIPREFAADAASNVANFFHDRLIYYERFAVSQQGAFSNLMINGWDDRSHRTKLLVDV